MADTVFGKLEGLRQTPIPDQTAVRALRRDHRSHPLNLDDPRSREQLVELAAHGIAGVNHYFSPRNAPYYASIAGSVPGLWVRSGVVEKLRAVNERLSEAGLELYVFDAWRPHAVQSYFHDVWMPEQLRSVRPDLEGEALTQEVERYWAAPTANPQSPAPHSTGGVLDLTIRWKDTHEHLWMGSIFDDVSEVSHLDCLEGASAAGLRFSEVEARLNRRLLYWVLSEAGFVGNPNEWWHFSHGDLMWARLTQAPNAFYGETSPPPA